MRKNFVLLVVGVFGVGILLYFVSPLSHSEQEPTKYSDETFEEVPPAPVEAPVAPPVVVPAPVNPAAAPSQTSAQTSEISTQTMKIFSQKLRDLGSCLDTQNNVPGDELEPNLQVLIDSVRGEWGEFVISTEDWMQVEMETPEGEKRRLRVEMDFDNETQVQRKLKFMNVGKDGQTTPIPMADDQAVEPSDSLIASLEAGNKILTKEKFERIYFQNGEEIVAKQKDGFLTEVEVNKGPKSFKCLKVNEDVANCQCVQ